MPDFKSYQRHRGEYYKRLKDVNEEARTQSLERESRKRQELEAELRPLRRKRLTAAQAFVIGDSVRVDTNKSGRIISIDPNKGTLIVRLTRTGKVISCSPEAAQKC